MAESERGRSGTTDAGIAGIVRRQRGSGTTVRQSRRSRLSLKVARNPLEAVDASRELAGGRSTLHDNVKIDVNDVRGCGSARLASQVQGVWCGLCAHAHACVCDLPCVTPAANLSPIRCFHRCGGGKVSSQGILKLRKGLVSYTHTGLLECYSQLFARPKAHAQQATPHHNIRRTTDGSAIQ